MGYNITGLIFNTKLDKNELEQFLDAKISFLKEVDFEEATSDEREDNTIDILESETGTLILMELGEMYDLSIAKKEAIQFMISDISDTYYFEKYIEGELIRKYITTEGETAEDIGNGIVDEDSDLEDIVWKTANKVLQKNIFESSLKRYNLE